MLFQKITTTELGNSKYGMHEFEEAVAHLEMTYS